MKRSPPRSPRLTALLLLLLLLAACGTPAPATTDDPVVIAENAVVTDATTRDALTTFDPQTGTLEFERETPLLALLTGGDILVSDVATAAPYGFLREVTEVDRAADGRVILTTRAASLEDVILEGSLTIEEAVTPDDVLEAEPLHAGVTLGFVRDLEDASLLSLDGYAFHATFDRVLFEHESGTVRVDGGIGFDLTRSLHLDYGALAGLRVFRFEIGVEERAELTVTASASGSFAREHDVLRIPLQTQTYFVGPVPVVLSYELVLVLGANGSLGATVVATAVQTASATLGAEYRANREPAWSPVATFDAQFETPEPPEMMIAAAARAYGGFRAQALLYGMVGPSVFANAVVEVDAVVPRDPVWRIRGGFDAGLRFIMEVPAFGRIVDYERTLVEYRRELRTASNTPPAVAFTTVPNGALLGAATRFAVRVEDLEDGPGCCTVTWSSDVDGTLGTGRDVDVAFATPGARTVVATATDSGGASTSIQATVDVTDPPPLVFLSLPNAIRAEVEVQLFAVANDPYEVTASNPDGRIPCSELRWTVSGATLDRQTGCVVSATFSSPGTQGNAVTVRATGSSGLEGQDSRSVVQVLPAPDNIISIDAFGISGVTECNAGVQIVESWNNRRTFALSATASDTLGRTLAYTWEVSTDPPPSGGTDARTYQTITNAATASYVHATPGFDHITFRLRVHDGAGNEVSRLCHFEYFAVVN